MNIRITEQNEIIVTAEFLSSFAASRVRGESLVFEPSYSDFDGADIVTPLSYRIIKEGKIFVITGEHNGIYTAKNVTVEKTKYMKKVSARTTPFVDSAFLAECLVCAFLTCKVKNIHEVTLKITFEGENGKKSFDFRLTLSYLTTVFDSLLSRCVPFALAIANFETRGKSDISTMPFPYPTIREGQRDFINQVYKTVKRGSRLLAAAPTGIGKTVSSLYPAIRALGDGRAEKIFYLTAKTVTGQNALDAIGQINKFVPDIRAISIIAKERICPSNDKNIAFQIDKCSMSCPRLGDSDTDYKTRCRHALRELLESTTVYEAPQIKAVAEKYVICPYELSLDLSEYCQVIVCDYNYVFDTRVRFRRYFCGGDLKYILLTDEAHNLPDRAREMYFASLSDIPYIKLRDALKKHYPYEGAILTHAENVIEVFEKIKKQCLENSELHDGEKSGYLMENQIPKDFTKPFSNLAIAAKRLSETCDIEEVLPLLEKVSDDWFDLSHAAEMFDEHFIFYGETYKDTAKIKLICLDPSSILNTLMSGAVASILFSATLTPLDYFADILGCPKADTLELESPYDRDNLCLAAVDTVSTKFSTRDNTASQIAEIILTAVSAKEGNYLVYFPSYKYMKNIVKEFLSIAPREIKAVMQKPEMSLGAREKFLSFFKEQSGGTLVGFCVLGGIFSEGIDLPGESLIGTVLVGIGLPGLCSELNILKEYYDKTREDGYNFAYVYPGMIKILQAAGRVIRSESDRGVVVLIDERYADPAIRKIMPSHWKDLKYVGNSYSLERLLDSFWES